MVVRHLKRAFELKNMLLLNFIILLINLFVIVMQLNQGIWQVETYFQPTMTATDKQTMLNTFKDFIKALDSANLTYIAYGGTLIGSYRHHGFIPWDDDVDVMLNASQKTQVVDVLKKLEPNYSLYTWGEDLSQPIQWKFFLNSLDGFVHKPFKWPYIDVFFFKENETHIWDEVPRLSQEFCFEKRRVFPLVKRPFEGININTPCDSGNILRQNYNLELCRSKQFSHMSELPVFTFNTKDVACERLWHIFPFVHRSHLNGMMNETLKISQFTLQSVILPSHCEHGE